MVSVLATRLISLLGDRCWNGRKLYVCCQDGSELSFVRRHSPDKARRGAVVTNRFGENGNVMLSEFPVAVVRGPVLVDA